MRCLVTTDASATWIAVHAGGAALLVVRSADHSDPGALLDLLSDTDPVRAVLDHLAADGVTATPPFALVERADGGARVLVRGAARVSVAADAGVVEIAGTGVATWVERVVPAASAVTVSTTGQAVGAPLPLEVGVVAASRVELGVTDADAAAPVADAAVAEVAEMAEMAEAEVPVTEVPVTEVPAAEVPVAEVPATGELDESVHADTIAADTIAGETPVDGIVSPSPEPESGEPVSEETRLVGFTPGGPVLESDVLDGDALHGPGHVPDEPAASDSPGTSAADEESGDHDGLTVLSGDVAGLRNRERPVVADAAGAAGAADAADSAGAAGSTARPDAVPTRRYSLRLADGRSTPLDGVVLIGRAPTAQLTVGRIPHLVTIEGDPDLSRTHARIALEGDTVVVTDLRSRNGTSVVLPGASPQVLRAGESTAVIVGTVVDLGGGSTITVLQED